MSETAAVLTPIETHYKGYRFRSRLEARWAVALDVMAIAWVYEPQAYRLSDGSGYLPDFWLVELESYGEAKPNSDDEDTFRKAIQLTKDSQIPVLLFSGVPEAKVYLSTGAVTLEVTAQAMKAARSARFEHGEFPILPKVVSTEEESYYEGSVDKMLVGDYRTILTNQVLLDDSTSRCACCGHRARNDSKGMTRWQAQALKVFCDHGVVAHASTLLRDTCPEAARDHGVALLRHWGLLEECGRPHDAPANQKGSRGVSGFYKITQLGKDFVAGVTKVPKNISKPFGQREWRPTGKLISFQEALQARLITDDDSQVLDGTTTIVME